MKLSVDDAFGRYGDHVFSAAFSILQNQEDADDVVQDTFLRYLTAKKEYESEEHIRAWLIRVAINRARDVQASFWRRNRTTWEDYMETLEFSEPADRTLFETVMGLPEKYRVVIHLFYYEEYSIPEIATILKLREGTVKSQLSRGRMLLKQTMMEEWNDDE